MKKKTQGLRLISSAPAAGLSGHGVTKVAPANSASDQCAWAPRRSEPAALPLPARAGGLHRPHT